MKRKRTIVSKRSLNELRQLKTYGYKNPEVEDRTNSVNELGEVVNTLILSGISPREIVTQLNIIIKNLKSHE